VLTARKYPHTKRERLTSGDTCNWHLADKCESFAIRSAVCALFYRFRLDMRDFPFVQKNQILERFSARKLRR